MIFSTKLNKKRSGIMLYETIICVFLIAICSGFILQFFLYAKVLDSKSDDIDNSTIILTNYMELSKNFPSLSQYYKDEFFDGSSIFVNDDNSIINIYKYYDNNWNTIYTDQNINNLDYDVKYVLCINIREISANTDKAILSFTKGDNSSIKYGNSSGLKYKLSGSIYYANDFHEPIFTLETTSYFSNNIK